MNEDVWRTAAFAATVGLVMSPLAFASQAVTYTGVSGVLSTPDALIAPSGDFVYQYNNLMEARFEDEEGFERGFNHVFTLGVYPRLEIGGRLTDFRPPDRGRRPRTGTLEGKRDLSGNAKLNLVTFGDRFWLAVGATDFAGLAQNFSAVYGVASARWGRATFSAGWAGGDNPSFDGPFANARYRVNRVVTLGAELDTDGGAQAGVALELPLARGFAIDGVVSGGDGETRAGIGVTYRLGGIEGRGRRVGERPVTDSGPTSAVSEPPDAADESPGAFAAALQAEGFQRVRVGRRDDGDMLLEVENRLYTHSAHDALTAIAATGRESLPSAQTVSTTLLDRGAPSVRVDVALRADEEAFTSARASTMPRQGVTWLRPTGGRRASRADFSLEPALVSAVGTEFGLIDYSLALRPGMSVPLRRGAQAVLNAHVPLARSENFEDGGPFAPQVFESALERAVLLQYFSPVRGVHSQVEFGQVRLFGADHNVFKAQAAWQTTRYPLLGHVRAARFAQLESPARRDVLLGTVRYTLPRWQAAVAATYGQFFFGERGVRLTAERWFGDTTVGLFIKAVAPDDLAGGLRFSTPIGPRKGFRWQRLTFTGAARWSHALQTTIRFPDRSDNRLQPALLFEPMTDSEIPVRMLDSSRLGLAVPFYH